MRINSHIAMLAAAVASLTTAVSAGEPQPGPSASAPVAQFNPPDMKAIPEGKMGDAIRYGHQVLTQTRVAAKDYVPETALNCTSCHLDGGRTPYAAPWVGIWGVFPEYRTRNAEVNSLQDRVNDCFQRSMNGKPLPEDSKEMRGILAYMQWLSTGVPTGLSVPGRGFKKITAPQKPDNERGKVVYAAKCAACHGENGEGRYGPAGETLFPALWGARSFNIGAGMARLNTAAAFVKHNMPLGQGESLSDQEAYDVASYFTTQPRPDFAGKDKDWPNGDKPKDARY
jgi:thiosulfate dehydrogenase